MVLHHEGFPIRKSAGQSLFPTNRSLSQVITSFVGSQCQGIHLMLFFAWTASLAYSLEFQVLAFLLELSQIIVWVANLKRLSKFTFSTSALVFHQNGKIVFYPCSIRKNLISKLKFFSIYNYLFRLLFGFQWTFCGTSPTKSIHSLRSCMHLTTFWVAYAGGVLRDEILDRN